MTPLADDRIRAQAISFFLQAGYLRLPRLIEGSLLRRLNDAVDALFARPTPPCRINDRGEVCRIEGLIEREEVFREVLRSEAVLPSLRALLGPNIEIALHRHNHVTLNRCGDVPFRLHRDVQQWSRAVLNVFIYLEEATPANGCTHIVPGSHVLPYAGPQRGGGGGVWADEYPDYAHLIGQEVPVPMQAGGVLLVNALTFHSVGRNETSGSRCSLVFACHSCDELATEVGGDRVLLAGSREFRGNPALPVSGSLRRPHAELSGTADWIEG